MTGSSFCFAEVSSEALDTAVAAAHERYRRAHPASAAADAEARRFLPGGNTRSVLHFEPFPFRVARGDGAELVDVDGHRYVDLCGNYSAGFLGHKPQAVRDSVVVALDDGWSLGAVAERESQLAERICGRFASIDQVRFTNSGTEANLMAIGTALHHTGRSDVAVFDRGYHGAVLSFGPAGAELTNAMNVPYQYRVAPFDDVEALEALFSRYSLACVLVEAVQGAGGCRVASPEFLSTLRRLCDADGTVLIFDEVMTSRLSLGGAQERFGLQADMTTLGKYLGGGMSFGAFGGRRDIMEAFDPGAGGTLAQAGTFNNNTLSMAAAIAALDHELDGDRVAATNARGDRLRERLNEVFTQSQAPFWATGFGSMLTIHADDDRWLDLLFHHALADELYMARRGFMALSLEITETHVDDLVSSVVGFVADPWAGPGEG